MSCRRSLMYLILYTALTAALPAGHFIPPIAKSTQYECSFVFLSLREEVVTYFYVRSPRLQDIWGSLAKFYRFYEWGESPAFFYVVWEGTFAFSTALYCVFLCVIAKCAVRQQLWQAITNATAFLINGLPRRFAPRNDERVGAFGLAMDEKGEGSFTSRSCNDEREREVVIRF